MIAALMDAQGCVLSAYTDGSPTAADVAEVADSASVVLVELTGLEAGGTAVSVRPPSAGSTRHSPPSPMTPAACPSCSLPPHPRRHPR